MNCFAKYLSLTLIWLGSGQVLAADIQSQLAAVKAVGPEGQGHRAAREATDGLQQLDAQHLITILNSMDDANPLALNWIRGIADTLVQRAKAANQPLPLKELETFLADTSHHPRARRFAYELIRDSDPGSEERLTSGWLNDPSLELRRDAISLLTRKADALIIDGKQPEAMEIYRQAFTAARDIDQVQSLAKTLAELKQPVDTAAHLGFIITWHLIGPFDNTAKKGFDVAYPPEVEIQFNDKYPGKAEEVAWKEHTTQDAYGAVDLNTAIGKHMGAIAYAYAEIISNADRSAELRIGTANANKIWLNGKLLTANEVYHSNVVIDQYVGKGELKKGRNVILVKVAQNEQTEPWAQDWKFQLRVCDEIGTPLVPKLAESTPETATTNTDN